MSRKLHGRVKQEKSDLSYADLHHEITQSIEDSTSRSSGNQQKQRNFRKVTEEDELVKYMSNLPGYLERGDNLREKVLNVGVLDWGRLEKWKYGYLSSTSNTSSSLSTDESSCHSSRGHSCSPARQRARRPSLQSHLTACPILGHSEVVKSSGESADKFQSPKDNQNYALTAQRKLIKTDETLHRSLPDKRMNKCNRKYSDSKIDLEGGAFRNDQVYGVASYTKLGTLSRDSELEKKVETSGEQNSIMVNQEVSRKSKTVVLLLPRDPPKNNSGESHIFDSTSLLPQKSVDTSRRSFSERSKGFHEELNLPHSCPLPNEVDSKHFLANGSRTIDAEISNLSAATHSKPGSTKRGKSPSKTRNIDERKLTMATSLTANDRSHGLHQEVSKVTSERGRSSSPLRRLSFGIGYITRGPGSREGVHKPDVSVKSGSENEKAHAKSCSENATPSAQSNISSNDKTGDAGRGRSSPLRRLLDPLLKPKAANCRNSVESSQKNLISISRDCRSANVNSSTLHSGKEKADMVSCSRIDTKDQSKEKPATSTVHALFQIALKNGLPLLTFAVDNRSEILAATVKKSNTSRKDSCSSIYTFFTFREVKKKNISWINHGGKGKGKGHDYIPHVLAQMKVSDSHFDDLTDQKCLDFSTVKEFVLFSVTLRQGEDQDSDYQPNDELAAVVVKIPKKISYINDGHQSNTYSDTGAHVSTTVVLPSGVHTLPSKGGPSSLVERWKSGGSCDCGGWDLGCKLKILANQNQVSKKVNSSRAYSTEQFELFPEGFGQENLPAFIFAPFKRGIYSVSFDSSLSLLQAFSICIAVLDGKNPNEISQSGDTIEGKTLRETISMQTDGIRAFSKLEGDIPASYVSYPPLSPVGRV
ncbi:DUF3527 domain protein [Quillaja saponaria]|uniref:DUF3527 domain protein n=1 Tax=Quillaja saponaria TaxID=32244 RepID=A0AAD7KX88_QUISA|nr:DUF3527 domain protein [Quillaja saponaria]